MRVRAGCVRRRAEVVAHQLSHTPQVDSIFNVPAGKDSLYIAILGANVRICRGPGLSTVLVLWALSDERFLRAHDAELVSFRIGQDSPGLSAGLPDVDPARPEREKAVNLLVAAGHTNTQIARRLGISEGTVGTHLENIYTRLNVSSRTAAVTRAFPDRAAV